MPINSCSWGFNFSKSVCVFVKVRAKEREKVCVIVQTISRLYARITHTSHETFSSFFEQSSRLHTYISLSLSLYLTHTHTNFAFTNFINPASQFHRPNLEEGKRIRKKKKKQTNWETERESQSLHNGKRSRVSVCVCVRAGYTTHTMAIIPSPVSVLSRPVRVISTILMSILLASM